MTETSKYGPFVPGLIYDGSCVRTADQLNMSVVLLAVREGWEDEQGQAVKREIQPAGSPAWEGSWIRDPDLSDWVDDTAEVATQWLNEHRAPAGYVFEFDDGYYLVKITCGNHEYHIEDCSECVREFNETQQD